MTKRDETKASDEPLALEALLRHEPIEARAGRITAAVSRRLDHMAPNPQRVAFLSILGRPSLAALAVVGCLILRTVLQSSAHTERGQLTVADAIGIPAAVASAGGTDGGWGPRWLRNSR